MIPTGQAEFISDGKFMALRAELQEQSMLLREILKAMQSSGAQGAPPEPAQQGLVRKTPTPKLPKEAVGTATVETVEEVDSGKTDDTAKADPWGKTEPVQMATPAPSPQDERGAQPPAVPKRGQTLTGQAETGSRGR